MASLEQCAELAKMPIESFMKLRASQRIVYANMADHTTLYVDTEKRDRIQLESEIAEVERRLASAKAEAPARFANGREQQARTREYLEDRARGLRRRLPEATSK